MTCVGDNIVFKKLVASIDNGQNDVCSTLNLQSNNKFKN